MWIDWNNMAADTPEKTAYYASALQQVVAAKAAWRKHAQSLTWEEKVAAIERMWVRDRELKNVREHNVVSVKEN
jgi:hypothetical protein